MMEPHRDQLPKEVSETPAEAQRLPPSPPLDVEKYLPYLADCELTEAQQVEILQALWSIMKSFVDLSFGLDSVQQLFPAIVVKALVEENSDLQDKADCAIPRQRRKNRKGL